MRVPYSKATHAVLGKEVGRDLVCNRGILYWHDNELDAYRECKRVNVEGGRARVVPAPQGELGEENKSILRELIFGNL